MEELNETLLRQLYLEKFLTEKEIANQFGSTQMRINRLRQKWGIPTLGKTGRINCQLPDALTNEQEQIIIGSLMGDGCIYSFNQLTARFYESHCEKQKDYLLWKVEKLRPFSKEYKQHSKKVDGKIFKGVHFNTITCSILHPYYDLFYPAPEHKKIFPADLWKRMTPLALAVWYMDDGGVTPIGLPRIAFGLDDVSLERALKALKQLGLEPSVYGLTDRVKEIHFPKQWLQFKKLVEPYLAPSMLYKIPVETERRLIDINARKLTSDIAGELYQEGMSVQEIARIYKVGGSTVTRRIDESGVTKRKSGPRKVIVSEKTNVSKDLVDKLTQYPLSEWRKLSPEKQEQWVKEVFQIYRGIGFPLPPILPDDESKKTIESLCKRTEPIKENHAFVRANTGLSFCNGYMPHRYQTETDGKSAWKTYHNDEAFLKVIRTQFKSNGEWVTPPHMRGALSVYGGNRTPANFRPTVMKAIVDHLCPIGGAVWDPCAGFGGRLLGAVCSDKQVKYICTEPSTDTIKGLHNLWARISSLMSWDVNRVQIIQGVAERDCPAPDSVDLVFTSPPYFSNEKYKGGEQSFQYQTYEDWLGKFLTLMVKNAYSCLHDGGYMGVNIQNVTLRGKRYPLVTDLDKVARSIGFKRYARYRYPLSYMGKHRPAEPILIYQKQVSELVRDDVEWDLV